MRRWSSLLVAVLAVTAGNGAAPSSASPAVDFEAGRAAAIEMRVTPDRPDWRYPLGASALIRLSVMADGHPVSGVRIAYKLGPENQPAEEKSAEFNGQELVLDVRSPSEPGFVRCTASVTVAGKRYSGLATIGFEPAKIQPTQTEPPDFDQFWARGKAELGRVPLSPQLELIPEASRGAINVYHVSFRNWSRTESDAYPGRIYGILCEPKAPGRYPAFLRLPAAGVRPYQGERALAEKGAITLEIGIHGIPVDGDPEIYSQLRTGALDGYAFFNLDDPDRYFFRRVHLGCLRALDFLVARESWDGRNLAVFGASQGGMLAVAAAALDPRVTAVAAMIPAYCDVTGYLHQRAGGWPHMFRDREKGHRTPAKIATTGYYDTVNFARRLRGPALVAVAFNDENCPPTSVFAAYNSIPAEKELVVAQAVGHTVTPEMDERVRRWLEAKAGLRK